MNLSSTVRHITVLVLSGESSHCLAEYCALCELLSERQSRAHGKYAELLAKAKALSEDAAHMDLADGRARAELTVREDWDQRVPSLGALYSAQQFNLARKGVCLHYTARAVRGVIHDTSVFPFRPFMRWQSSPKAPHRQMQIRTSSSWLSPKTLEATQVSTPSRASWTTSERRWMSAPGHSRSISRQP